MHVYARGQATRLRPKNRVLMSRSAVGTTFGLESFIPLNRPMFLADGMLSDVGVYSQLASATLRPMVGRLVL